MPPSEAGLLLAVIDMQIARAKFCCFSKALTSGLVSGLAFLTWLIAVPSSAS